MNLKECGKWVLRRKSFFPKAENQRLKMTETPKRWYYLLVVGSFLEKIMFIKGRMSVGDLHMYKKQNIGVKIHQTDIRVEFS